MTKTIYNEIFKKYKTFDEIRAFAVNYYKNGGQRTALNLCEKLFRKLSNNFKKSWCPGGCGYNNKKIYAVENCDCKSSIELLLLDNYDNVIAATSIDKKQYDKINSDGLDLHFAVRTFFTTQLND